MGRERYIPLTDAELRRMEEEVLAKKKLVEIRQALIAKTFLESIARTSWT